MRIDTRPRPITEAQVAQMKADLKEALVIATEAVTIKGDIVNALQAIRHYKSANRNVATHIKKCLPDVSVYVSENYGNSMRLSVSWGQQHSYKFQRRIEWRFEKGESVAKLLERMNADTYEESYRLGLVSQLENFARMLAGEAELRRLACQYEEAQGRIKHEIFGPGTNGYVLEPLREHLSALCAS